MTEKKNICGKVARILNSRELVINCGTNLGVEIGMYFDVLDQKGEDIRDPDTNEVLGSIERPKVRVKVNKVQKKICVAATYKKTEINTGGQGFGIAGFANALMPPKWVAKYETLKTEEQTWENLSEEESFVKIGDPVVQVIESANDD
jgi:hypothetical protein